jgi:urease accessory protein
MGTIIPRITGPTTSMSMSTHILMTPEDATLTLMQWLSPGFPVGAFAYSHGLERVIDSGDISDIASLEAWLRNLIPYGGGHADVVLLASAYNTEAHGLIALNNTALAFAASSERLLETTQQGAAFAQTVDAIWGTELGPMAYPVAVGRAAKLQALPLDLTARMYLHAFAANLISAAVRLVPLGQTDGQRLLSDLAALISDTAQQAIEHSPDDLASHCFAADIAAMQHETQYSKVFRT